MDAFDTHQRLNLLKRFLAHLLVADDAETPRVLDVGGHPGLMAKEFENELRVVTVDIKDGGLDDYILASGCRLPFRDGSFEATVASDVLEHVAEDQREDFLSEMARVSKGWVLVGGPFRSPEVAQAEASVNELNRLVLGRSNVWLDEHWQFGLPDLAKTRGALKSLGLVGVVVPNGTLFSWFLLKSVELLFHAMPNAFQNFEAVNELYIHHWSETDHQRPTYRHLLLAHRDEGEIEKLVQSPPSRCTLQFFGPDTDPPPCEEEAGRIRAAAARFERIWSSLKAGAPAPGDVDGNYLARLEGIVETQEKQRLRMEKKIETLRAELARTRPKGLAKIWKRIFGKV